MRLNVDLKFKIQDMWIGVYWENRRKLIDIWVCAIPTLPLHIRVHKVT